MKKQLIYTYDVTNVGLPASTGQRAECYRLGNFVYMTGQTGITLEGQWVGLGDAAAQARQACDNIRQLMQMAGGTMADVVKLTVYVTDRAHRAAVYPVIREAFRDTLRPCQTGIVAGLAHEDLLVEIDAWGFIDDPE